MSGLIYGGWPSPQRFRTTLLLLLFKRPLCCLPLPSSARRWHDWETVSGQGPASHWAGSVVIMQEEELGVQNVDLTLKTLDSLQELCNVLILGIALRL